MEHVSSVRPTGKFPEKVENLKRWSRFPGWNFRTECRVPFTLLVVCTSSRSTVGHPATYRGWDQMEQLFTNRKFHFCYHRNFRVFFVNGKRPWPDPLVQRLSCGAYLRVNNISVSCAPIWFSFSFFLSPSLPSFRFFSNTVNNCLENSQDIFSAFCSIRFFKGVTTLLHSEALLGAWYHVCSPVWISNVLVSTPCHCPCLTLLYLICYHFMSSFVPVSKPCLP